MTTTVCVLDPASLEESQKFGLHKNFKLSLRKRKNVAIGISKKENEVNVIRTASELN